MLTNGRNIKTENEESVNVFNNHYIITVENSCNRKF